MSRLQPKSESEAKLAEACRDMLLGARRKASRGNADADDVAQDACVRALDRDAPGNLRDPIRYLLRIARNLVIDRRRRQQRDAVFSVTLSVIDVGAANAPDPERILAGKQDLTRVLSSIASLPPRCREAFICHRFKGLSYAATARRMGISTSMVEKHVAEAMVRLTRALSAPEERAR